MTAATDSTRAERLARARETRARRKAERTRSFIRSRLAEQPQPPLSPDETELLAQAVDRFNADIRVLERYEDTRKRYCRMVFDLRHPEDGHSSPITPETSPEDLLLAMDACTLGESFTDVGGGFCLVRQEFCELSRRLTREQSGVEDPGMEFFSLQHLPEPEATTSPDA